MADADCFVCDEPTKYRCITCNLPICNVCCVAELDEDTFGWLAQVSVGYCNKCAIDKRVNKPKHVDQVSCTISRLKKKQINSGQENARTNHDEIESSSDSSDSSCKTKQKVKTKRRGRKAAWKDCHVDDLVDVILNDENFKKNLIFTNIKKKKNTEAYQRILEVLLKRYSENDPALIFPFDVKQIRIKFKWCVAICKMCLTIRFATGIKRIQD